MAKATVAAAKIWGPVYLRFGREKTPVITTDKTPFVPGKAQVLADSVGIDYKEARAALTANGGAVIPVYLSMKKPLIGSQ